MGREISLAIMAHENFSDAVTTMRNANQAFNKDLSGTMQKLDAFNKNKITLKVETDKAKQALKEAEKQFSKTGDAADKMALELANSNYENARRNLDLVAKNARQAEKDILSMTGAISKAENRAGTGGGAESTMMKTLANAGLFKLAGDSVSSLAGVAVSSALGNTIGGAIQSTLSSAATGAAMGSMTGNPMGIAIGAGVGAASGLISSATSVFSSRDEAFKSAVQDSYNSVQEDQKNTLSSGTTIAAQRQQDKISFSTMLGGSDKADAYLTKLTDFAAKTPFGYDQLTNTSKTLLTFGYKIDEILPELTKIGDAGGTLGWSSEDMNWAVTALGRMRSTGKTSAEYTNMLQERGVKVWDYLSQALGKSKEAVMEMASKGLIPGAKAAKIIADGLGKEYSGGMAQQSETYNGLVSSLQDAQDSMDAAMGTGFMEERAKGLKAQNDYLSGDSGEKMKEANRLIGQYQASLENLHEEMLRQAQDKAMESDDYKKAEQEGNALEMGRILAEAKTKGENEYLASEGYQAQLETNKTLISNIREDKSLNDEYWNTGIVMGQQFSKGLASVTASEIQKALEPGKSRTTMAGDASSDVESAKSLVAASQALFGRRAPGKAFGMARVPYYDFPAMLHEGERVLTASEARSRSAAPNIAVNVNGTTVREEADIDKIARKVVSEILKAMQITN